MTVDKEEVFTFLDALRESAEINMMGASPSIIKEFKVTKAEAFSLLMEWMKSCK